MRFWRDRWCGDSPLCVSFPSLFALTDDKEAWVVDIWDPLAKGGWGDGTLVSQEPLMIGRWRRRKASWSGYMGRECKEMWKTWCFGPKQRVENSRSNPSTMLLSQAALLFFLQVAFGTCGCNPRLASFLRRLHGAKL